MSDEISFGLIGISILNVALTALLCILYWRAHYGLKSDRKRISGALRKRGDDE